MQKASPRSRNYLTATAPGGGSARNLTPNARDVFLGQDRILIQANKILATLQAAEDAARPASGKLSVAR